MQKKVLSPSRIVIYQLLPRLFSNYNPTNTHHGTLEENGCGKLNKITEKALEEIRKLGATHIWFTGLLEHATCTDYSQYGIPADNPLVVKGRAGSPYAIKDYYDIAPDLAEDIPRRMHEFESLVERCRKTGLGVIMDFVPNHVARQYASDARPEGVNDLGEHDNAEAAFLASNNFYYLPGQELQLPPELYNLPYVKDSGVSFYHEKPAKVTGNNRLSNAPRMHDWYETVKLNYGVNYLQNDETHFYPAPDTWYKMRDILMFWAGKNIDGFRCDMAEMVPVEFWNWVIPQVKEKYPKVLFIAEIYNPPAYQEYVEKGKFDYLYDKMGLYDTLRAVVCGETPARQISAVWKSLNGLDAHMLRFIENHDEQRIASKQFAGDARRGIPAMAVAALMHTGPVMVYNGQECGEPAAGASGFSTDDGRTSIFDYCSMPQWLKWANEGKFDGALMNEQEHRIRNFYEALLNVSRHEVFSKGDFYDLMWCNPESDNFNGSAVYTFMRYMGKKAFLVVTNFHKENPIRLSIQFPNDLWELMNVQQPFSVYGKDRIWDGKEFFADGAEFTEQGLTILCEFSAVYAFELEITSD